MSIVTKRLTQSCLRSNLRRFNTPKGRLLTNKQGFGEDFYFMISALWGFTTGFGCFVGFRDLYDYERRRWPFCILFVDVIVSATVGTILGVTWPISIPCTFLALRITR